MTDQKSPSTPPKPARIAIEPRSKPSHPEKEPKPTRLDANDTKVAMHHLEDAFGGSDHAQAEIRSPQQNGWSFAAWGGFFLFLFFLVAMAADAFFTLRALSSVAPWLGWVGLGLLGLGLTFFTLMIGREWMLAGALRQHRRSRLDLDAGLAAGDTAAATTGLQRMEKKLRSRPDLAQEIGRAHV